MKTKDKKLYKKIIQECHNRWLVDNSIFDEEKNRYILDIGDGFILFYPSNGKIHLSTSSGLKMIFRDHNTAWMLTQDIKKIVDKLYEFN